GGSSPTRGARLRPVLVLPAGLAPFPARTRAGGGGARALTPTTGYFRLLGAIAIGFARSLLVYRDLFGLTLARICSTAFTALVLAACGTSSTSDGGSGGKPGLVLGVGGALSNDCS